MKFVFFPADPIAKSAHYHGDKVRTLFFIAGIIMLLGLPFFQAKIPIAISLSLVSIIMLVFLAGLTNPKQVWFSFFDLVVSMVGVLVFEYYAVTNFSYGELFFWVNQILAVIFFLAFYFSVKTLRGFYLR